MNEHKHLYGTSARLFVNTELGCRSSCAYCYLPAEGLVTGKAPSPNLRISAQDALARIATDERVRLGRGGTIFSIGCFSECWDHRNKGQTQLLVREMLRYGNPVQIATKREIRWGDLDELIDAQRWNKQLSVFVSSASLASWKRWEQGTTAPKYRFRTFAECTRQGVSAFLYIKPVLPGITLADAPAYGQLMRRYSVAAVVGDRFESGTDGALAPISRMLVVRSDPEAQRLRLLLSAFGPVFRNSVDAIAQ